MNVLIVEDELLVAMTLEDILVSAGYRVAGIATDLASAMQLGCDVQLAFVDLNLRDGLTGPGVAQALAQTHGTRIVYVTANPAQIGSPPPQAIGYIEKPFGETAILATAEYARTEGKSPPPPALRFLTAP